ncbi:dihydroorotase [Oculatella sp. LEGE 06141]|uniref:dihydroorotase n=1 Tax=Oculatella sp. LEGE 06141 TaxID=1828648 RepID=UPI00187E8E9F|nr:dihydroorotase [Oculatella sp. LEGE 06141]MBE9178081.1 dihydroorotase [Oculatella sp. LEGE 06141]
MTSELLRQVRLLDPVADTDRVADVLITDGTIAAVEPHIGDVPAAAEIVDRPGLVLGTGLIDLYSHSGEPGFESRETLQSLRQAAIAGGFTRLTVLPDTQPAIDHPGGVEFLRSSLQSSSTALPQVQLWGALTLGAAGKQLAELADLAAAGVVGFAESQSLQNWALLRRSLEYAQPLGKPIALWCWDAELSGGGVVRDGVEAMRLGLPGNPSFAETAPLAALLECVAAIGTPVHLMRVSTARSVEQIAAAKASGLPITASTTWMHLLLNINAVQSYDPSLRLEPPLGNPTDQAALIDAVEQGIIDAIAIDHTPYTYEEKTVAFAEAPPGAIGLELALPLLWQRLVESGNWSALTLWRALSVHPARCLGQPLEAIAPNQRAELTLFDPQQTWKVTSSSLKSTSTNTPWLGQELIGRVIKVWTP